MPYVSNLKATVLINTFLKLLKTMPYFVIFSAFCIINNFTHQITFKKSMLQYLKTTYVYQVHFLNEEYN
jgi:hypothetical protein